MRQQPLQCKLVLRVFLNQHEQSWIIIQLNSSESKATMFNNHIFYPHTPYVILYQPTNFTANYFSFVFPAPTTTQQTLPLPTIPDPVPPNATTTEKILKSQTVCSQPTPAAVNSHHHEEYAPHSLNSISLIRVENRNVLPNNINLVLSYIRRINKSGKMVQFIISRQAQQQSYYTVKRFYAYQIYLKENSNDFIIKNALTAVVNHCDPHCSTFTVKQQLFYNKVCRILVQHYLSEHCMIEMLGGLKIKKSRRDDHLKAQRYLKQLLKGEKGLQNARMYQL